MNEHLRPTWFFIVETIFFLLHIFIRKKEIEINVIKFFNEENELVHSNQLTFELKQISTKLVQPIRRIVN